MSRKLKSWLKGLKEYASETEAPKQFWAWGGISTIASALQRKVWLPFGFETCYPNLFVILVGPPASRKAGPVVFSRKILKKIQIPTAVDSSSKRRFTMELAETGKSELFRYEGKPVPQCTLSICSPEMSSLLSVNPKEMIETLTDLYDCPDSWDYGTRGQGEDRLYNACVNCLIATTPTWLARNLPEESIGGGYTSRHVIVYGSEVPHRVTLPWHRGVEDLGDPKILARKESLFSALTHDLAHISQLIGEFTWDKTAFSIFDKWYQRIDEKIKDTYDERLHPFIGRMHMMVLKVAMCLRVDTEDTLILTPDVIETSISLLESVLTSAPDAFGSHGRSKMGPDVRRVMDQLKLLRSTTFSKLLSINYRHLNRSELKEVLETIHSMGYIRITSSNENPEGIVFWLGAKKPGS